MTIPTRRNWRAVMWLSLLLAILASAAFVASFFLPLPGYFASWGDAFHVGLTGAGWDRRVACFNDARRGIYPARIADLVMDLGEGRLAALERETVWDAPGVHYCLYQWPRRSAHWSLTVSLAYPIIAFTLLPLVGLARAAATRRPAQGTPRCEVP